MGLTVDIFRSTYRSKLSLFDGVDQLTIVNLDGPSEPRTGAPAALLVDGNLPGILKVVAAKQWFGYCPEHVSVGLIDGDLPPSGCPGCKSDWLPVAPFDQIGPMFGGTFAGTSDSRWASATKYCGAVAIHDRFESVEDYKTYSD